MPVINVSLAAFPGMRHEQAAIHAIKEARRGRLREPVLGKIAAADVQLVPQSFGMLTDDLVDSLKAAFPDTRFRLHANVRVLPQHRFADLSGLSLHGDWFAQAARIHKRVGASAYTAHSGSRAEASMAEMLDNARRAADMFGTPVGVEGQYPVEGDTLLVSSWDEYRQLFESGVPYAVDLSHLHILACRSGSREDSLLREMLSCERYLEVHLSDNDGKGDQHQICTEPNWWLPLLSVIHPAAVVFTEGNHRRKYHDGRPFLRGVD